MTGLTTTGETAQILALWHRARAGGDHVCLATVVHVEGSSYRKPGARMLVTTAGERAGTVSGGCLEAEVSRKAWWLTRNGPALEQYQSSFDEDGGGVPWGLGCGGTVWILFEQDPQAVLAALEASVRKGEPAVIISRLSLPAATGENATGIGTLAVLSSLDAQAAGRPLDLDFEGMPSTAGSQSFCAAIERAFAERRSFALDASLAPATSGLPACFVEYLAPPPHLTLFGAGEDVQPIALFADALGWRLSIADGRSHLLRAERFPASAELRLLHYGETLSTGPSPLSCGLNEPAQYSTDPASAAALAPKAANATVNGTETTVRALEPTSRIPLVDAGMRPSASLEFAVLLTHSYDQDRALLAALLPQPLDYLGVLGPRHRTRRLIDEIAPVLGWTGSECFARLHSPVGLDLGASDPAAIALAIVAELQATVSGRDLVVRKPDKHGKKPASSAQELAQTRAQK